MLRREKRSGGQRASNTVVEEKTDQVDDTAEAAAVVTIGGETEVEEADSTEIYLDVAISNLVDLIENLIKTNSRLVYQIAEADTEFRLFGANVQMALVSKIVREIAQEMDKEDDKTDLVLSFSIKLEKVMSMNEDLLKKIEY